MDQFLGSRPGALRRALPLILTLSLLTAGSAARAGSIATWTFETSQPSATSATIGPLTPEVGAGSASGGHVLATTVWSSPAGNGSSHSFSSNMWSIGDFYQFQVSTVGLQQIQLAWDQTSSATGPKDFELLYGTDGTNFTNFGNYTVLPNANPPGFWNVTTAFPVYSFSRDLSGIPALNNAASVYFRLAMVDTVAENGGTIGTGGTDRVDNFSVTNAPEPSSMVLAGIACLGLALVPLRRRALRGIPQH
jgi:hypothetical protein